MSDDIDKLAKLKAKIDVEALKVAERQGLLLDARLLNPDDHYFEKPQEWALHKCAFYQCAKCTEPFFGGLVDCELEMA